MMNDKSKNSTDISNAASKGKQQQAKFNVEIISFGFKNGSPPLANLLLDVRFLKNPYWVEELRPLTGRDAPVRSYVLDQRMAQDVLETLISLVEQIAPAMFEAKTDTFTIALGCTGGQHRSTAMVEVLADRLKELFPTFNVTKRHRELDGHERDDTDASEDGKPVSEGSDSPGKKKLAAQHGGKTT